MAGPYFRKGQPRLPSLFGERSVELASGLEGLLLEYVIPQRPLGEVAEVLEQSLKGREGLFRRLLRVELEYDSETMCC